MLLVSFLRVSLWPAYEKIQIELYVTHSDVSFVQTSFDPVPKLSKRQENLALALPHQAHIHSALLYLASEVI
jgi:hypothetical protein